MQLIGAGLPRTGTLTQKVALEMLGLKPCYHMVNILSDLSRVPLWQAALDGDPDWERIFGDSQATVDWPGGFFYRELLDAYPDAKVLLSVRDPMKWEHSMRETVWACYFGPSLIAHMSLATAIVDEPWRAYLRLMTEMLWEGRGTLSDRHTEPGGMAKAMVRHTEAVKRDVPSDRLLIWDPLDGWEPLCRFLDVDVPSAPLPRLNDTDTFQERIVDMALAKIGGWRGTAAPANGTPQALTRS
jgi:hypothetical protein